MNFAQMAKATFQTKHTENGARAYNTTGDCLLDFFSTIGAMRSRSIADIQSKFASAYKENPLLATKALFYGRDIRNGGLGERRAFRACLKWLSDNHSEVVRKNIKNIPFFGRYDDLYCLLDRDIRGFNRKDVLNFIVKVLYSDIKALNEGKQITLLAKWLPSINTSSKVTRYYAKQIIEYMGIDEKFYRKLLSAMRNYIKVTEKLMSTKQWEKIEYEKVPSYAMKNYNKAFLKQDGKRFQKYLEDLKKGEKKINASTLYPYDLVHKYSSIFYNGSAKVDHITEAQWNALPNYVEGENNIIVMADVSGSMYGRPIETSIGLATYFAQRNHGDYHGLYMTFSSAPHFVNISNFTSLHDCVKYISEKDIGYSTNLNGAFDYLLKHAVAYNIKPEDMPKAIVVISDMEINRYQNQRYFDFLTAMKIKFHSHGYACPKLIMWNVEARQDTFLSQSEDVIYVGGQSASIFKKLCGSLEGKTAYDFMLDTLNAEVYNRVIV